MRVKQNLKIKGILLGYRGDGRQLVLKQKNVNVACDNVAPIDIELIGKPVVCKGYITYLPTHEHSMCYDVKMRSRHWDYYVTIKKIKLDK